MRVLRYAVSLYFGPTVVAAEWFVYISRRSSTTAAANYFSHGCDEGMDEETNTKLPPFPFPPPHPLSPGFPALLASMHIRPPQSQWHVVGLLEVPGSGMRLMQFPTTFWRFSHQRLIAGKFLSKMVVHADSENRNY
jgi:hypothetical protein